MKKNTLLIVLLSAILVSCGGGEQFPSSVLIPSPSENPTSSSEVYSSSDETTSETVSSDEPSSEEITSDKISSDEQSSDETTSEEVDVYYEISFNTNGGSKIDNISVLENEEVLEPETPTFEGMNFVCWCYDKDLTNPVSWPLVADQNYSLYAKWNNKVDIVGYLKTLLNSKELNPYNFIPEKMRAGYEDNLISNASYDYANGVNIDDMVDHGHGEQWAMIQDNLLQSQTFYNALSVVEGVATSSVAIFQNYFDKNPSETAKHSFKNGEYNVFVDFDGKVISYVLDYVANIPVIGEVEAQILLSMDVETGERTSRIQLGDANALVYRSLENSYEFAIKYLGVRRAYFSIEKDEDDNLSGHIYEILKVGSVETTSAADFYINDNYVIAVGNKASGLVGFSNYITEVYNVNNGKLIAYEVLETQSISAIDVTFNTLWFDLHDIEGIDSIKYVKATSEEEISSFYINGLSTPWDNKTMGITHGLKTASRRFDIEFRTQYFYQYDEENETYQKVAIDVPMLFVQEEVYDSAIKDIKSTNKVEVEFKVNEIDLNFLMNAYDTLIEVFISNKDLVTADKIVEIIGNPVTFE